MSDFRKDLCQKKGFEGTPNCGDLQCEYGCIRAPTLHSEASAQDDRQRGIYPKYLKPARTDGGHLPGGKHATCGFFVLDIEHDPFAIPALLAYAKVCESQYPLLAEDIRKMLKEKGHS